MSLDYEKQFAGFFDELGEAARVIALQYFRKNLIVDEKEDKTPVTQADRGIEQKLRELINKKFPAHGIIGEEFGKENEGAEFVWVIDPIDGTKAFSMGRPTFGTIIGLFHNGKPMVGLIDQAYTKERWFGIADKFCLHNGQSVKVAAARTLSASRFHTTAPDMFDGGYEEAFERLRQAVKWPQYSCDCYAYGLLALGWLDLVIERKLKVYDMGGVIPIVTGAGGFAADWNMQDIGLNVDGTIVAASSKALALEALAILKNEKNGKAA